MRHPRSPSAKCNRCGGYFVRQHRHCPSCFDNYGQPKAQPAPAVPCFAIGVRVNVAEIFTTTGGKLTDLLGTVTRIDSRYGTNYVHIDGLGDYMISPVHLTAVTL